MVTAATDRPPRSATAAGSARDLEMFEAGRRATRPAADCWVPVDMPWRHVQTGDLMVGADGSLYLVRAVELDPRGMLARVEVTADGYQIHAKGCDPDAATTVLV
ncbi:MAG: hypothetical protein L0K86_11070, partial [Actinomycetia bacterium]|nr:hypothetical protein [Actinomycetes bacterium]